MKRIRKGISQLVSPFPEYSLQKARELRREREASSGAAHGLGYVLLYLISSRGENLLVDCGWNTDGALSALFEESGRAGIAPADVQKVVITHAHPDHCGLAGRLESDFGCEIALHELELEVLHGRLLSDEDRRARFDQWCNECGVPGPDRKALAFEGLPRPFFGSPIDAAVPLKGGEVIEVGDFALEVIWTPGHAPGHICLFEHNDGILFTGDHVLPSITPNVSLDPYQRPNPLQDFLESLHKLQSLNVQHMLPAHEWDSPGFEQRLSTLIGHHETRLGAVLDVLNGGRKTALDVAKEIPWTSGPYTSLTPWMQRAAIGEALAHLAFLVHEGRAIKDREDGIAFFEAA